MARVDQGLVGPIDRVSMEEVGQGLGDRVEGKIPELVNLEIQTMTPDPSHQSTPITISQLMSSRDSSP